MTNRLDSFRYFVLFTGILVILMVGCSGPIDESSSNPSFEQPINPAVPVDGADLEIVTGQTLYVPAYSGLYDASESNLTIRDLTVMLAVHNPNLEEPIIIETVQYYDMHGQLVKVYVESPLQLAPMATANFVIDQEDRRGGTGANFIVEWGAEAVVHDPIVEAIMMNNWGHQALAFRSPARVIEEIP